MLVSVRVIEGKLTFLLVHTALAEIKRLFFTQNLVVKVFHSGNRKNNDFTDNVNTGWLTGSHVGFPPCLKYLVIFGFGFGRRTWKGPIAMIVSDEN